MQREDRIIHFSTELIHRPAPLDTQRLKKLYFDLSQGRAASYDSTDFTNPMQPRFYSRRGKKTQSLLLFLPDRAVLIEEWADVPLSDYLDRVAEVSRAVLESRSVDTYVAHTATIRSTFALTHFSDAREFIMDHACGQKERIAPYFRRPIAVGGLRFVLPETNEHPGALHIAIESFRYSRNEVFVETKGIFGRRVIGADELHVILDNIRLVRDFIGEEVYEYLNQFDRPRQAT